MLKNALFHTLAVCDEELIASYVDTGTSVVKLRVLCLVVPASDGPPRVFQLSFREVTARIE